jgi:hypothetical protein
MQIQIESPRGPQASADVAQWRAVAERRLRFVMRRLRTELLQAHVRLEDVNGPRGGVDQRCQVHLVTDGFGSVVVHATRRHAAQALDAALKRAAHALVRTWQKQRRPARQPLRTTVPSLAL